jgi:hypothetical protein
MVPQGNKLLVIVIVSSSRVPAGMLLRVQIYASELDRNKPGRAVQARGRPHEERPDPTCLYLSHWCLDRNVL